MFPQRRPSFARVHARTTSDETDASYSYDSSPTAVDHSVVHDILPTSSPLSCPRLCKSDSTALRWSEVIPPETALTFGAIWDPVDGMCTFSGAALSACSPDCSNCFQSLSRKKSIQKCPPRNQCDQDSPSDPLDLDKRSQVLTIDRFMVTGASVPNTATSMAQDDLAYLYSRNGSALRLSTPMLQQSPARCSSAGTSGILDTFIQMRNGTVLRACEPRHSRASRYGFLVRHAAGNISRLNLNDRDRTMRSCLSNATPKSTATPLPLRSLFSDSCWNRSAPKLSLKLDDIGGDQDAVALDLCDDVGPNGDCPVYYDQWQDINADLNRDMGNLKSAFSWTTSSTSRYIDVAAVLQSEIEMEDAHAGTSGRMGITADRSDTQTLTNSEWFPVDPPSPPSGAWRREQPRPLGRRRLHKPKPIYVPPPQSYNYSIRVDRSWSYNTATSPAPAAEVLARRSYNHEWPGHVTYQRTSAASSSRRSRASGRSRISDVRDVLKGIKTAIPWSSASNQDFRGESMQAHTYMRRRPSESVQGRANELAGTFLPLHHKSSFRAVSKKHGGQLPVISSPRIRTVPSRISTRQLSCGPRNQPRREQLWGRSLSERIVSLHETLNAPIGQRHCKKSSAGRSNSSQLNDDSWITVDFELDTRPVPVHSPCVAGA